MIFSVVFAGGDGGQWHENEDNSRHCSLTSARRYAYIIADLCCDGYKLRLLPNCHVPADQGDETKYRVEPRPSPAAAAAAAVAAHQQPAWHQDPVTERRFLLMSFYRVLLAVISFYRAVVGSVKDVLFSLPYRRCEVSYQASFDAVVWTFGRRADRQEEVSDGDDDISRQFFQDTVEHRLLRRYSCATKTCFGFKKPHCWVLNSKRREFDNNVIHLNEAVVGHGGVFERGVTNVERVYSSRT